MPVFRSDTGRALREREEAVLEVKLPEVVDLRHVLDHVEGEENVPTAPPGLSWRHRRVLALGHVQAVHLRDQGAERLEENALARPQLQATPARIEADDTLE